jgi:long-chain fatty acid transport protein
MLRSLVLFWSGLILALGSPAFGQGIALRAVSPINESMAGVATACPVDSAGALQWNPASISGLPGSDVSFGMEMILPSATLSSSVKAGAFGPGVPAQNMSGWNSSESGVSPAPSMAFVRQVADSPWSYGLGMYAIGGSAVNYSASLSNAILTPQPPNGFGLGRLSANVDICQIAPTVAYQLNERLSVGFAPTITLGKLYASPLFLGPKNDANGDGFATWSSGVGTRYAWGGGFQLGAYYSANATWHFGASIKSPQWMEPFRFKSENELGQPVDVSFAMNYPLIASIGTSYTGFENWVFGCDVRYLDYADTTGFRRVGFAPDGALQGLSWNSVMSVAVAVQRQLNEHWIVRGGYCFNESPIDSEAAQYNVASPLILQHSLHMGFSYAFDRTLLLSLAYEHSFENSVSGPMHAPSGGDIPNTLVTNTASADVLGVGVSKRF